MRKDSKLANCIVCNRDFKRKWGKANKYCSHQCYWRDMPNRQKQKSSAWKYDLAKYGSIHKWIHKHWNKELCLFCGSNKRVQWANISGEYLRVRGDWINLCQSCHSKWDRLAQKRWRTQKIGRVQNLYAIDLDGVLCKRNGIFRKKDFSENKPMDNAVDSIKKILSLGSECYVFTSRTSREWKNIVLWLYKNGFPGMQVCNIKKEGITLFIDDRAIRFENNWQSIVKLIV